MPFYALLAPLSPPAIYFWIGLALIRPFSDIPFVGWIFPILMTIVAFGVAFQLLRETANAPTIPDADWAHVIAGMLYWKQLGIWVVAGIFYAAFVDLLGTWFGTFVFLPVFAALPAATMVLAIEGSLVTALSPPLLIEFVRRLGRDYWIAYVVALVLFTLTFTIQQRLAGAGSFGQILHAGVGVWALFAAFCWFGAVMRHHADELWESPPEPTEMSEMPVNPREAELLRQHMPQQPEPTVAPEIENNSAPLTWQETLVALNRQVDARPADTALQRKRWAWVQRKAPATEILAIGAQAIPLALEAGDGLLAVQMATHCLRLDPQATIGRPLLFRNLVKQAKDQRLFDATATLGAAFLARHPDHDHAPEVLLLLADQGDGTEPLPEEQIERLRTLRNDGVDPEQRANADLALRLRGVSRG